MTSERKPRLRPMSGEAIANVARGEPGISDAELYERLDDALAALPADERAAAVVAFSFDEGSSGVAAELGLSDDDAEALSRSALQLLRGALADVDVDGQEPFGRLGRRRRIGNHRPGDGLTDEH